ncbi:MAG: hypothetical protein ACO1OB_22925 [Archangium sp.]
MLTTIALLALAASPDCAAKNVSCARWNGFDVAVTSTAERAEILVMRPDGSIAASAVEISDALDLQPQEFTLDVAKYRSPTGAPAFGVRRKDGFYGRFSTQERTSLSLYVLEGSTLRRVLRALPMTMTGKSWAEGDDCEAGSSELTRTVWNDEKHRLVVRTVRHRSRREPVTCRTVTSSPKPSTTTLEVKDGVFVVADVPP